MSGRAVIITGASKGVGRAVALAFAGQVETPLHFIISGRNQEELVDTKDTILKMRENKASTTWKIVNADLSNMINLEKVADDLFDFNLEEELQSVTFINNAGSLGAL